MIVLKKEKSQKTLKKHDINFENVLDTFQVFFHEFL